MTEQAYIVVLEVENHETAEVEREYAVCLSQPEILHASQGTQGPSGPVGIPGPAGGSALQRPAGETVSALRMLYEQGGKVYALDYRDAAHIDLLLGVSLTAADIDQPLNVQRSGVIEDAGWGWTLGRVWLGAGGALTQTPPVDGFDVLIGAAVSATRITLNIQDPIKLE